MIPAGSFFENLCRHSRHRSGTALEYLGQKITYSRMFQKIDETAAAFSAQGVRCGDIVSVCLPNIPEVVYIFYALNKLGTVSNMLDPRSSPSILRDALLEGGSVVLVTLDAVQDKFVDIIAETQVKTVVVVSAIQSLPSMVQHVARRKDKALNIRVRKEYLPWRSFIRMGQGKQIISTAGTEESDAVIAYTGGTTGVPKGVIASNRNINAVVEMELLVGFGETEGERLLDIAPPWTYYGLCNSLNVPLCMGLCVVLVPKLDPDELGEIICRLKPNHVVTVPSSLHAFINDASENDDYGFVKSLIVGADKLDEPFEKEVNAFLQKHNCKTVVSKGYGMTEVMAAAAYTKEGCNAIGSVGVPYPGNNISAFFEEDRQIRECQTGQIGEIAICGPTIMKGYFGSAASETDTVKQKHADGQYWIHTGDLGYIGLDGRVYIEGRTKRMFVSHGYKVFPGSIEKYLMEHPLVKQAAVVPVQDEVVGNSIRAFVVLSDLQCKTNAVENELKTLLSGKLYDYELPDSYMFVSSLPLTPMGKTDYKLLEEANENCW